MNAYTTTFITTGTAATSTNGIITLTGAFSGANNTFSDSGKLTTGGFIYNNGSNSFVSVNSMFRITGTITSGTGSIANGPLINTNTGNFFVPRSNFFISNLNSSTSGLVGSLFNVTSTVTVSKCNFTISGTTNTYLINVNTGSTSGYLLTGRNSIYNCSTMPKSLLASTTHTYGKIDISNSIVDFTLTTSPGAGLNVIVSANGIVISPLCTYISQMPGGTYITRTNSTGYAVFINSTYRCQIGSIIPSNNQTNIETSPDIFTAIGYASSLISGAASSYYSNDDNFSMTASLAFSNNPNTAGAPYIYAYSFANNPHGYNIVTPAYSTIYTYDYYAILYRSSSAIN
jgi:hypothetical protein